MDTPTVKTTVVRTARAISGVPGLPKYTRTGERVRVSAAVVTENNFKRRMVLDKGPEYTGVGGAGGVVEKRTCLQMGGERGGAGGEIGSDSDLRAIDSTLLGGGLPLNLRQRRREEDKIESMLVTRDKLIYHLPINDGRGIIYYSSDTPIN